MEIAARLRMHHREFVDGILDAQIMAVQKATSEEKYFDCFFPALENFLNSQTAVPGLGIRCRTARIHKKPIVKWGPSSGRKQKELGDFFVSIKYYGHGGLLGRKVMIHQVKREDASGKWSIDLEQLELLRDFPKFEFGKVGQMVYSYSAHPMTPFLGSYWLAKRFLPSPPFPMELEFQTPAIDLSLILNGGKSLNVTDASCIPRGATWAAFRHLIWEIGESAPDNSETWALTSALYRYVNMAPDPPGEFDDYMSDEDRGPFWGVEIVVKLER